MRAGARAEMAKTDVAAGSEAPSDPLLTRNRLLDFVSRRLGKRGEQDPLAIIEAVEVAARAYARLNANRGQVLDYRGRKKRLSNIAVNASSVAILIEEMDALSRDQIGVARDDIDLPRLVSELRFIASSCASLLPTIQKTGKPRDTIEELWIQSIARIYVELFEIGKRRLPSADFFRFLRLSLPSVFRGGPGRHHGALTPRQIERALSRTGKDPQISTEFFGKALMAGLEVLTPKT